MRISLFSLGLIVSILSGIGLVQNEPSVNGDEPATPMPWQALFNGKDLDGWEGINSSTSNDWKIVDGVLECHGLGGGWIVAPGTYGDFQLQMEFRISPEGNSGVFLRAPPRSSTPHVEGLEVQILDDAAQQDADLDKAMRCGSLLLEAGPKLRVSKKPDQWQKLAVDCRGSRIRVALNGEIIVDVDLAQTKPLENHPGRERTEGSIGFQDHGERVDFRNIFVRELP